MYAECGASVELNPEREDELLNQVLADQVGVDPDQLRAILELAALGLVNAAWRNTAVENWHAAGRIHDGDMLRINSHSSWRVRQILSRWRAQIGISADALTGSLDSIDFGDFRWLAGRIYQWIVSPRRRLPTGVLLAIGRPMMAAIWSSMVLRRCSSSAMRATSSSFTTVSVSRRRCREKAAGPALVAVSVGFGLWAAFGLLDAAESGLLGPGEAFSVDAQQHGDAVACPFGHAGGLDTGVEPGG